MQQTRKRYPHIVSTCLDSDDSDNRAQHRRWDGAVAKLTVARWTKDCRDPLVQPFWANELRHSPGTEQARAPAEESLDTTPDYVQTKAADSKVQSALHATNASQDETCHTN